MCSMNTIRNSTLAKDVQQREEGLATLLNDGWLQAEKERDFPNIHMGDSSQKP